MADKNCLTGGCVLKKAAVLLRWSVIALTVGPACGYLVVLFKRMATSSGNLLYTHTGTWYYVLPLAGGFVAALLYLLVPGAAGEGMPTYVESVRSGEKRLPTRVTVMKFFTSGIVLASGGSGGMVGPMSRVTGGVGQDIGDVLKRLGLDPSVVRRSSLCGAAAGISAVLGAPVAGALFAVEILYADGISYEDVFPALLSSAASFCVVYTRADYAPFLGHLEHTSTFEFSYLPALVAVAVAATAFGALFCKWFSFAREWMYSRLPRLSTRCLFGAVMVVITAVLFGRAVLGPGTGFIEDIVAGRLPEVRGSGLLGAPEGWTRTAAVLLVFLAFGKMFSTTFTIGSGLSAGLTYPSLLIGAAIGAAGGRIAGVEAAASPETHYAFVACGVAAVLSGVMNIPLTAAILVAEMFGLQQSVPGIIGSVIAYSLARHIVIYRYR
jgi:CIC family chloride channel protein